MNLIFDLNYILHKNINTLYKTNDIYGYLYKKLTDNINKYVHLNQWDNIYIVSDSRKKSWRQEFLNDYKGKRKRLDINWEWIYEEYDKWKKDIKEKYHLFQKDKVEGDDWVMALVKASNKLNQSCVVISSDKDLAQLIKYKIKKENSFINIQISDESGREKVYLPEGWNIWYNEYEKYRNNDIFELDNGYYDLNFFTRIKNSYIVEEINHYELLFLKLVSGDKGDNIGSIYEKLTNTGKPRGIGLKSAEKIWTFYKTNYKEYFDTKEGTFINDIINCVENLYNVEFTEGQRKTISNKIKRNISLIELHYRHYPEYILDDIVDTLQEIF